MDRCNRRPFGGAVACGFGKGVSRNIEIYGAGGTRFREKGFPKQRKLSGQIAPSTVKLLPNRVNDSEVGSARSSTGPELSSARQHCAREKQGVAQSALA